MTIILLTTLIFFCFVFILSSLKKRNDYADIAWGVGFIIVAWTAFIVFKSNSIYTIITNILVSIWGARLSLHILSRNLNKCEDIRYQNMRKSFGKHVYIRSFIEIFLLQWLLMLIISIPVIFINTIKTHNPILVFLGITIWILGFTFESIADYQLKQFKNNKDNKGKLMMTGLWSISRHPNYFGEITQWWGIWVIALCSLNIQGILTVIGPLTITLLILKVSGIPMLEKHMGKYNEYSTYKNKVKILIPYIY